MYQRHQGESGEEEADTQLWQRDTGCGVQQKHLTSFFFFRYCKGDFSACGVCFNFYLLQQSRQGLVFGGCLILLSVIPEMPKSGIHYMSLNFLSLHFLSSFFFFFFFSYPPLIFYFPFQCLLPHVHPFPPFFKCSSPILPSASFPPLPSPLFVYHQIGFSARATSVQTPPELLFTLLPLERLHFALC